MVKLFSKVGKRFNFQHKEVRNWLNNSPKFKNAIVFAEFQIPYKNNREVDMIILLPDRIILLELKNYNFTKISSNESWEYWDHNTGKTEIYTKRVGNRTETPFEQAVDTANKFREWIRSISDELTKNITLRQFFESDIFTIYPVVYLPRTCTIVEENISKDNWCWYSLGPKNLGTQLYRKWKKYDEQKIVVPKEIYEIMAEKLGLSDHKPSRKGPPNQIMISIVKYMVKNHPRWINEYQIKHDVFESGNGRLESIRKALRKANKINLISPGEKYLELNPIVLKFYEKGFNMNEIRDDWEKVIFLSNFQRCDPDIFEIYVSDKILPTIPFNIISLNRHILYASLPGFLQNYSVDQLLLKENTQTPEYFRPEGLLWSDIQHGYFVNFFVNNQDTINEIQEHILDGNNILINGKGSTGKTSLIRILSYHLLHQEFPVLHFIPEDLDQENISLLLETDAKETTNDVNNLIIILENIHTATAEQIQFIQTLIENLSNSTLIMTSRKKSLMIQSTDILKEFQNEEKGVIIDLNNQDHLVTRTQHLIEQILSRTIQSLTSSDLISYRDYIINYTAHSWPLMQIELTIINEGVKTNTIEQLLTDEDFHHSQFSKRFLIIIEDQIPKYRNINELKLEDPIIREILYLLHIFAYLEVPLRSNLIKPFLSLSDQNLYQLFRYWKESKDGILNADQTLSIHPIFAEKFLEIIPGDSELWQISENSLHSRLISISEDSLINQIRQKLIFIDPSISEILISDEFSWSKVDFSQITGENLQLYAQQLSLEDLTQLIFQYSRLQQYSSQSVCNLWDQLTLQALLQKIEESNSLWGVLRFLNEVEYSRWEHFHSLIESLSPDFFISLFNNDHHDIEEVLRDLKRWNYTKYIILEIRNALHQFFRESSRYGIWSHISFQGFELLNRMDPENILKIIHENPSVDARGFLTFLVETQKRLDCKSTLLNIIIRNGLEDGLLKYPISYFCHTLEFFTSRILPTDESYQNLIEKWDFDNIRKVFLHSHAGWLRYFFTNIAKWDHPLVHNLVNLFTLEDVILIWSNPKPNNEEPEYLIHIFEALKKVNWIPLPDFMESFGVQYFVTQISPSSDDNYYSNHWFRFLLQNSWPSQSKFISNYDFITWAKNQDDYAFTICQELIFEYIQEKAQIITQIFFEKSFPLDYAQFELKKIIDYSKEHQWKWEDWVNLEQLIALVEKNQYRGKKRIKFLEDNGWKIPSNIRDLVKGQETISENNYLTRLSKLEKAGHYIRKGKIDLSLPLFMESIQSINYSHDYSEIRSFLREIKDLTIENQKSLLKDLSPDIFPLSSSKRDSTLSLLIILQDLQKLGYGQIPEMIVNVYCQIPENNTQIFWEEVKSSKLIHQQYRDKIVKILMEQEEYKRIIKLPIEFKETRLSYQDQMEIKLQTSINHWHLWELYFFTFSISNTVNPQEWKPFLSQIYKWCSDLQPIILLVNKFPHSSTAIIQALSKIETTKLHLIFLKTSDGSLLRFLTHEKLEETWKSESIETFISLLSKDEWETRITESDPEDLNIFLLYTRRVYQNVLPKLPSLEEILWDLE